MAEVHVKSPGCLVAEMLRGSWRMSPPPLEFTSSQLKEITPLLQKSGAAALSWRRVQHCDLRDFPHARQLHQSYRRHTLRAALIQQTIKRAISLLRSIGIEPILVKGWAAARLYPEHGLRPYGDIDLCVRPEQLSAAKCALKNLAEEQHEVDLHCGFETLGGGDVEEMYARSQLAQLEETSVLVLSAEDHLRVLSIHMLREGAWRPLWLCDIAAAVEARPARFDWDQCLGSNRRQADWIICSIALAEQLLGANVSDTPASRRANHLPRWLIATILKEWESEKPSMTERHIRPM
ncbi:MAG TPA: nucleotidyltransferase family protein, partial [Pyrinomonadaceae bacterium]|nr:nucleotidyltransferase family protein [Pyrinomonadaceae bacterium]